MTRTHTLAAGVLASLATMTMILGQGFHPVNSALLLAIWTCYLWLLADCYGRAPGAILDADSLLLFVFGCYVVLPVSMNTLAPDSDLIPPEVRAHFLPVTEVENRNLLFCTAAALVGIVVGFAVAPCPGTRRLRWVDAEWGPGSYPTAVGLLGLGAVTLGLLVLLVGLDTYTAGSYVETYAAEDGLGLLGGGVVPFQLGLCVLYLASRRTSGAPAMQKLVLILFLVFSLLQLRIGRRSVVLNTGAGLLFARHFGVKPFRPTAILMGVVTALVSFAVIGQARAHMRDGLDRMIDYALSEFTLDELFGLWHELCAVCFTTNETARLLDAGLEHRMGLTYLEAFATLIPRQLFVARPLAPSQWFVWQYDARIAAEGGGFAYSHMAEGYLNFGYAGVMAAHLVLAALVRGISRFRAARPSSAGRLLLVIAFSSNAVMLQRADFASYLKICIVGGWVPAAALVFWLSRTRPTPSERSTG